MSRYRRGKGFKPTYDKFATAHYVSRKARNLHGARLAPAAKTLRPGGGWYFWFPSPRASAALRGNHRVEAILNDGGGGGGPTPPEIVAPATSARWFLDINVYYYFQDRYNPSLYPTGITSRFTPNDLEPKYSDTYLNHPDTFEALYTFPNGFSTQRTQQFSSPLVTYTAWTYTGDVEIVQSGDRIVFSVTNATGDVMDKQFNWTVYDSSGSLVANYFLNGSSRGYGFNYFRWLGPRVYVFDLISWGLYPIDFIAPGPYYGDSPPAVPEGFLATPGPYAYRCTCQDFTFAEQPYAAPAFPSQRRARSWNQTRPLSPCKHIVSAARALADMRAFDSWWVAGQKDVFPQDYPHKEPVGPGQAFLDKLRRQAERTYGRPRRPRRRRWNPWSWQVEARELAQREWNAPDRRDVSGAMRDYMTTRSQVAEDTYRRTYENEVAAGSPHRQAEQAALDRTRETLHEIPAYDVRNPVDRARFRERESARYPDRNIAQQAQAVPPE